MHTDCKSLFILHELYHQEGTVIFSKRSALLIIISTAVLIIALVFITGNNKDSSHLKTINSQQFEEHIKSEDHIWVYIGRPTCPMCEEFLPVLTHVLKEQDQQMYYYNTDEAKEENGQKMMNILNRLEVDAVPTMIYFEQGKMKKKIVGYQDEDSLAKLLADG